MQVPHCSWIQARRVLLGLLVLALAVVIGYQREPELPHTQLGQKGLQRTITAGETHNYYVRLDAPHYFHVKAEQAVSLTLYGPDGQMLDSTAQHKDPNPLKSLFCRSCAAGTYRVALRRHESQTKPVNYQIDLFLLLPDTDANRRLIEADYNEWLGWRLHETETAPTYREAIGKLRTAAALWRELGSLPRAFNSLMFLGEVNYHLSEYRAALDAYFQAAAIIKTVCDDQAERCTNLPPFAALSPKEQYILPDWTYNSIGKTYSKMGETAQALEFYRRSWAYGQDFLKSNPQHTRGLASPLTNLGETALTLGEKQKAFDYFTQALSYWRRANNGEPEHFGEARALLGMGEFYRSLGEHEKALEHFRLALKYWREGAGYTWQVKPLIRLGQLYRLGEQWKPARENLAEAVRVAQLSGNRDDEATARANLGYVYLGQNDATAATGELTQALTLAQTIGNRATQAFVLTGLGLAAPDADALSYYNQALTLRRAVSDREGEAETLYHYARTLNRLGRLEKARQTIAAALTIIEEVRGSFATTDLRASYLANFRDYYEFEIDLLMRLHQRTPTAGYERAALRAAERARARSLWETLNDAGANLTAGVAPELLARERAAAERLRAKADALARLTQPISSQTNAAEREVEEAREAYHQAHTALAQDHASQSYNALAQTPAATESDIRALLDTDTLLLEYSLGRERSYLWVVSRQSVNAFTLPSRSEIETAANDFYKAVKAQDEPPAATAQDQSPLVATGERLSQLLLGPAAHLLGQKRLLIVGEGMLQYVPFAALPEPKNSHPQPAIRNPQLKNPQAGEPLIVKHEIVNLPSALTLAALRREAVKRPATPELSMMVLADPVFRADDPRVARTSQPSPPVSCEAVPRNQSPSALRSLNDLRSTSYACLERLPATRREAESISKLLPPDQTRVAFDFEASYQTVTASELSHYRILHFATHGVLNSERPELSGLAFSLVDLQGQPQNGFLWAHEIYNLKLPADLVVLSACETALGKDVKGEGLMSLTRGFMYAGASRVVASLWKVQDSNTADLMSAFYAGLLRSHQRPSAALQAAQIALWRTGRPPRYWAAFTIQGEYL